MRMPTPPLSTEPSRTRRNMLERRALQRHLWPSQSCRLAPVSTRLLQVVHHLQVEPELSGCAKPLTKQDRRLGGYTGRWCIKIVRFAWPLNLEPYLIRTEIGMPRPVILLSALQAILASIF